MAVDTNSITWQEVEAHAKKQIEALRDALEFNNTPHDQAQFLRGKICAYRELLELGVRREAPATRHNYKD